MKYTAALAGNPNSGKTTLFNMLTGSDQYVGNWSGVTVEKKEGRFFIGDDEIELVDLPGIYSLSPYTMEEVISRDYICQSNPDIIINIADGTNLERNLYLTLQLAELEVPMVLAVNMCDELKSRGITIRYETLAKELGMAVMPISAKKGLGTDSLLKEISAACRRGKPPASTMYKNLSCYSEIEHIIKFNCTKRHKHYISRLLDGDSDVHKELMLTSAQKERIKQITGRFAAGGDTSTALADARYSYIEKLMEKSLKKTGGGNISDKIDRVVTNRFLAIPIFLLILMVIFLLIFGPPGNYLRDKLSLLIHGSLAGAVSNVMTNLGSPEWCISLIVDGIIGGVGAVVCFLPQIILLFLFLTLLEDSGYMARAAFITDGFMHKLGLSGKSFIPMLMGFGCTVPAVMAARGTENKGEKRLTIMLVPFMSCSARMPIYVLFAGALFNNNQGPVIFSVYLLGIIVAVLCGLVLKKSVFRQNDAPFLLELPPYRLPGGKGLARHLWDKCRDFLLRAGTLIFSMSVIIWVLHTFTPGFTVAASPEDSLLGVIGRFISPVFAPLGFNSWQASVSLLSGVVAKESVVSSLTVLYGAASNDALLSVLPGVFSPLSAYSFMIFSLLYTPCIAAFGAIKREMGSWRWALGTVIFQTLVAYLIAMAVFQVGSLFI